MRTFLRLVLFSLVVSLSGCGYNTLQSSDEQSKASWSEVVNQYQRRADLVPNLVNTVKGYAAHEQRVLTQVTQARAQVGAVNLTPEALNDPAALAKFQAAQSQLSSALSRLLVVSENYPQLKADAGFRDLQAQLEGTENRVAQSRREYNEFTTAFNRALRTFPRSLISGIFGFEKRALYVADPASQTAPKVDLTPSGS